MTAYLIYETDPWKTYESRVLYGVATTKEGFKVILTELMRYANDSYTYQEGDTDVVLSEVDTEICKYRSELSGHPYYLHLEDGKNNVYECYDVEIINLNQSLQKPYPNR